MLKIIAIVGIGVYLWGAWKFWTGFRRTNFEQGRLPLSLLWPVLLVANSSYRRNFQKALKG